MQKFKGLLLSSMAVFVLAACGGDTAVEEEPVETPAEEEVVDDAAETDSEEFTEAELSEYNGQDGNAAYVAVDGVVYDVTDSDAWNEGEHAGQDLAGTDATDVITESPHGEAVLDDLPVVGSLVE